jgi:hypothetical protein
MKSIRKDPVQHPKKPVSTHHSSGIIYQLIKLFRQFFKTAFEFFLKHSRKLMVTAVAKIQHHLQPKPIKTAH